MVRFGYVLSSEEHRPADLIRNAARAEESGLEFALISDHNRGASAMAATISQSVALMAPARLCHFRYPPR